MEYKCILLLEKRSVRISLRKSVKVEMGKVTSAISCNCTVHSLSFRKMYVCIGCCMLIAWTFCGYGCFLAKSSKLFLEHLHLPTGAQSHLCTHIHTAALKFDARISKCFKNCRIIQNLNKLGYSETGLLLGAVKKKWLVL